MSENVGSWDAGHIAVTAAGKPAPKLVVDTPVCGMWVQPQPSSGHACTSAVGHIAFADGGADTTALQIGGWQAEPSNSSRVALTRWIGYLPSHSTQECISQTGHACISIEHASSLEHDSSYQWCVRTECT